MSADLAVTRDQFLDGRLTVLQPERGFRAAIDPILLAAAAPARAGETVLDAGTGTGVAALCLAARVPDAAATGLDIQEDLIALARESARLNGLAVAFLAGDISVPPAGLGTFGHVICNPPYLRPGASRPPPDAARRRAMVEQPAGLEAWLDFCVDHAADGGTVTFIHRTDRGDEVADGLRARGCGTVLFPLWSGESRSKSARVIVQGRKGGEGGRTASGLVLHGAAGEFTPDAQSVLRGGAFLNIH